MVNNMKTLWEKEYNLRGSDFDKYDHIKPSAILDLFQDAAGQHANEINVRFSDLLSRGILWVLTRVKFKIVGELSRYQRVVVKTWPLAPNRLNYRREYAIEDLNGNKLVLGSSEWVIIDSTERKFLSVPDLYPFTDGFNTEIMFDEKLRKLRDFEACGITHVVNANFNDLDINNHVNNIKYANFVIDAINPEKDDEISVFQIDYRKEVVQGDQINILFDRQNQTILAKGQNNEGEILFSCSIELK